MAVIEIHRGFTPLLLLATVIGCSRTGIAHKKSSAGGPSAKPGLASGPTQPFVKAVDVLFLSADGRYLDRVATQADDGELRISMLDFGPRDYELIVSTEGALDKSVKFKYDPALGATDLDFLFDFGDLNADNKITPDEVEFVRSQIGKDIKGAAFYGDGTSLPFPGMADIDRDREVTNKDLEIIESNVGKVALKPKSLFER
jgi:hypothetical protein